MAGKIELVEVISKTKVRFLALKETKKKEKGCETVKDGFILLHSGVPRKERARAGVGFLVHKDEVRNICEWKCISERIMWLKVKQGDEEITMVVVYAPNEDECAEIKDEFYDKLQSTVDDISSEIIILGDLNGRVGNKAEDAERVIGIHGESNRNNNGIRLLQFALANDMIITNTMFPHKEVHKFTRAEPTRNEKSIIDYILVKRSQLPRCRDARVMRGPEIGSDHYLVTLCRVASSSKPKKEGKQGKRKNIKERIKISELKTPENQERFKDLVTSKLSTFIDKPFPDDLEETWSIFKQAILTAAEEVCGKVKCGGRYIKATKWWNDEIKLEINEKKKRWKTYLSNRSDNTYQEYKDQRIKVKNMIKEAKKKEWEEFGNFLEESFQENQKLFYKVIKKLRKQKDCPIKFVLSKKGEILRDEKRIMARWREYFLDLLNVYPKNNEIATIVTDDIDAEKEKDIRNITLNEMSAALRKMKLGKAAGHDAIAPEMLKYMGKVGTNLLLHVINLAWEKAKIPKDWEVAVITPIFKKGDNRACENHRGISLLSVPGKIYSRILTERLNAQVEHLLEEEQCGFRTNRGTQDLIFTMRQLSEKTLECGKATHVTFIDLEKAFDSVQWSELWKVLRKRDVEEALIKRIKSFYKCCRNYVRTGNSSSEEFLTTSGVRQGDIMSPYLFIILLDDIIKECKPAMRPVKVGNWRMNPVKVTSLAYADDVVLMANSEEGLQHNLNVWNKEQLKRGLNINPAKTETMVISKEHVEHSIKLNNTVLKQVNEFKYLGAVLSEDGKPDKDLNTRVAAAGRLYHALNKAFLGKKEISTRTKLAVYKSTYVPTLTYGCESWALTSNRQSRIQAMEMRYLRRVAGKTRRDRVRNQTLRANLKVEALNEVIDRSKMRWFGHVVRMENHRIPKQVFEARIQGKRPRGRPRMKWIDSIEPAFLKRGIDPNSAKTVASDRKRWRKLCSSSTPQGRRGQE